MQDWRDAGAPRAREDIVRQIAHDLPCLLGAQVLLPQVFPGHGQVFPAQRYREYSSYLTCGGSDPRLAGLSGQ